MRQEFVVSEIHRTDAIYLSGLHMTRMFYLWFFFREKRTLEAESPREILFKANFGKLPSRVCARKEWFCWGI